MSGARRSLRVGGQRVVRTGTARARTLNAKAISSRRGSAVRKLFTLTTVASGAAIGIIIVGVLAIVAGIYTRDVVHDQLAPQKIYFPEKGDELPPELNKYAGQQVDTGAEAKAYADDYIGAHLEGIGGGQELLRGLERVHEGPQQQGARAAAPDDVHGRDAARDASQRVGLGDARHDRDDRRRGADRAREHPVGDPSAGGPRGEQREATCHGTGQRRAGQCRHPPDPSWRAGQQPFHVLGTYAAPDDGIRSPRWPVRTSLACGTSTSTCTSVT